MQHREPQITTKKDEQGVQPAVTVTGRITREEKARIRREQNNTRINSDVDRAHHADEKSQRAEGRRRMYMLGAAATLTGQIAAMTGARG